MNTIPSTFSEQLPPYTLLGTAEHDTISCISAVVLNRAERIGRRAFFDDIAKCGFDMIVSIENGEDAAGIEEILNSFNNIKFLLIHDNVSTGAKINAAANEIKSPLFFVFWDDQRLSGIKAERIHERLVKPAAAGNSGSSCYKRLCTVPVIQNQAMETIPTMNFPVAGKKLFECAPLIPEYDDFPTLYPFDGAGIYDRERFIALGGFDGILQAPYWQYLDFGLRAWLWGEEIRCDKPVRLCATKSLVPENSTTGLSYLRFFLKNLAPVFVKNEKKADLEAIAAADFENETLEGSPEYGQNNEKNGMAHIPFACFFPFALKSRLAFKASWHLFLETRRWVKDNSTRFTTDSRSLFKNWLKH
ncbi:MAG: hypothetical protein LBG74_03200 [Spirochaetaceae bacterium]|jgi:hypothetical protein|nr:hypothetical protein [Spirochaetaceae bacterium]